jgi:hypothetical protein
VGSCTLIGLRRRTVQDDENQHGGEGTERHCQGKEGARVLQDAQWIRFVALSFADKTASGCHSLERKASRFLIAEKA